MYWPISSSWKQAIPSCPAARLSFTVGLQNPKFPGYLVQSRQAAFAQACPAAFQPIPTGNPGYTVSIKSLAPSRHKTPLVSNPGDFFTGMIVEQPVEN